MREILVLGGTQFVGRVFMEEILRLHPECNITLFNRGRTNQELFPECRKIIGDRNTSDISQVLNQDWDCIMDFSCYDPEPLRIFIPLIKSKVRRYIFVSTVAVYDYEEAGKHKNDIKEDAPLKTYDESMIGTPLLQFYGNKKAECERILLEHEDLDAIILRPSIIFGKYNHYERIYYWMHRLERHSEAILPDGGTLLRNYTFVDDFARMILAAMDLKAHRKTYNATSFAPIDMKSLLEKIRSLYDNKLELIDIPQSYLVADNKMEHRIPMWSLSSNLRFVNNKLKADFQIPLHDVESSFQKTKTYYESIEKQDEGNIGLRLKKEKAILLGYFLDQDDFNHAAQLLGKDCCYQIGTQIIEGPESIVASYRDNMLEGRAKLDGLEWGESRVEDITTDEFYIHYTDYLTHKNQVHTHRCKQKVTVDDQYKISRIEHINDDDEQQALDAFYIKVGLK